MLNTQPHPTKLKMSKQLSKLLIEKSVPGQGHLPRVEVPPGVPQLRPEAELQSQNKRLVSKQQQQSIYKLKARWRFYPGVALT